jgi:hypothetical protein
VKYIIGLVFLFLLSSCTGYSIASLSSNIATYAATGKTNSDHAVSFVTGKDCRIARAITERNYCEEKKVFIVENEVIENLDENEIAEGLDVASLNIIKSDSNLIIQKKIQNKEEEEIQVAFLEKVVNSFYYGSLTWAEDQITKGAIVSDKIGLTEDLTTFIEDTFDYYFY